MDTSEEWVPLPPPCACHCVPREKDLQVQVEASLHSCEILPALNVPHPPVHPDVIFALDPMSSSVMNDVQIRTYNLDKSEPEMCGNRIHCYAQLLLNLKEEKTVFVVETLAGPIMPQMNIDKTIIVDMGVPVLSDTKKVQEG